MSRITIVGSGVVGTATGKGFASADHDVTFVDVAPTRLAALRADGHHATDQVDLAGTEEEFVFLTLPTPNVGHRWDMSAFESGARSVGRALASASAHHTVVVRSTVPPGTTEQLVLPILEEQSGRRLGEGFSLAAAPEFLRAASATEDFKHPWMTVIGSRSRRTIERLTTLFAPFGGNLRTFDKPAAAELVKCQHNIYNAAKISFFNEMWTVATKLGLDHDQIASTIALSAEASFNPFYGIRGGAPYGGVCLPKDTKGFLGFAADLGVEMPVLRATVEMNDRMEQFVESEMGAMSVQLAEPVTPTAPTVVDLRDAPVPAFDEDLSATA